MTRFSSSTLGGHAGRWLIITAVFELVLAGFFVYLGLSIPIAAAGMFVTALILAAVGAVMLIIGLRVRSSAAAADRLARIGIPGRATLTSLTQTGMYLNQNPQLAMDLLVQLAGRQPYAVTKREFVPLILLGRLASGAPLPVKVDPAEPQKLIIDWPNVGLVGAPTQIEPLATGVPLVPTASPEAAAPASGATVDESLEQVRAALAAAGVAVPAPFGAPAHGVTTLEQLRAHLRLSGLAGHARIDRLTDTGKIVGNERLYTMALTLELPGQPPEQLAESAAMVPLTHAHKVRVGARMPVRVAADNHQLTMFEWEKL